MNGETFCVLVHNDTTVRIEFHFLTEFLQNTNVVVPTLYKMQSIIMDAVPGTPDFEVTADDGVITVKIGDSELNEVAYAELTRDFNSALLTSLNQVIKDVEIVSEGHTGHNGMRTVWYRIETGAERPFVSVKTETVHGEDTVDGDVVADLSAVLNAMMLSPQK